MYYLTEIAEIEPVTIDHVYTCYRSISTWKIPKDMVNSLQQTASHRGWLETSDRQDLTVESGGMNLVEHELPRAATKKK